MSKKIQNKRTLWERPVAESAALADTCSRSLRLHVRCLAYSATGRLQFSGDKYFRSTPWPFARQSTLKPRLPYPLTSFILSASKILTKR